MVSDIPAGGGKTAKLFSQYRHVLLTIFVYNNFPETKNTAAKLHVSTTVYFTVIIAAIQLWLVNAEAEKKLISAFPCRNLVSRLVSPG